MLKLGHFEKYIRNTLDVLNVMLDKEGENNLDRLRTKLNIRRIQSQGGKEYPTHKKQKEG
jgi:hypothetical protein